MPVLPPLSVPTARPVRRHLPSGVGTLVLTAFGLAAVAVVSGHAVGLVLLCAATVVLAVAAAVAMGAHWVAAAPVDPRPASGSASGSPTGSPAGRPDDTLTAELRRLHAVHVEKVNLALDEGREDLAREFADAYTDQALVLLTRAG